MSGMIVGGLIALVGVLIGAAITQSSAKKSDN